MKYTQTQWDREIGWGKVPEEYKYKTKLEEYKSKINYDVWEDVTSVPYNITVNYSMKASEYVQPCTDKSTRSNNGNDKS